MNDEEYYLKATNEVNGEGKQPALWAKVMALSEGDNEKAKYKYIKLRVEQLSKDKKTIKKKEDKIVFTKKTVPTTPKVTADDFSNKYMPVSEFSNIKSIPEKKVIEMIKGGFYAGQIKETEWFVSREELGKEGFNNSKLNTQKIKTEKEYVPVEEFARFKGMAPQKIIDMIRDGFYQGQIIDGDWYISHSEVQNLEPSNGTNEIGFQWWQIWAWLGLTLGNLSALISLKDAPELAIILIIINSTLMVMILKYNKYAFLIATILSLNPLAWIINGIYLKNRWNHPKVNK